MQFTESLRRLEQINILEISEIQLAKLIRDQLGTSLAHALITSKLIKKAHDLGVVRGKCLK